MDDDDLRVIRFVCTDRGQHPETKLGNYSHLPVSVGVPPMISGHKRLDPTLRGRKRRVANSEFVTSTLQLECPRCGRTPQLSTQTLAKLAGATIDKIDVSALPF